MKTNSLDLRRHLQLTPIALLAIACLTLGMASACGGDTSLTSSLDPDATSNNGNHDTGNNGGTDAGPDAPGGEDSGGQDADADLGPCFETTPQEAATFADDYAQTLCEKLLTCEQNPKVAEYVTVGGWSSVELCKQSMLAGTISPGQARQAVEQGSLRINSCEAADCLAEIPQLDCRGIHRILTEARFGEAEACYAAWRGTKSAGEPCTTHAQCAGEQICSRMPGTGTCTGTCTEAGQSGSGQCGSVTCRYDQYCGDLDNEICFSRKATGETCEEDYECYFDARCTDGRCAAISTGRGAGESCGSDEVCSFDLGCINNQCTAFAAEGESCNVYGCDGHLFCNNDNKCEPRRAAGESCSAPYDCESLRCVSGTCAALDSLCPGD